MISTKNLEFNLIIATTKIKNQMGDRGLNCSHGDGCFGGSGGMGDGVASSSSFSSYAPPPPRIVVVASIGGGGSGEMRVWLQWWWRLWRG